MVDSRKVVDPKLQTKTTNDTTMVGKNKVVVTKKNKHG